MNFFHSLTTNHEVIMTFSIWELRNGRVRYENACKRVEHNQTDMEEEELLSILICLHSFISTLNSILEDKLNQGGRNCQVVVIIENRQTDRDQKGSCNLGTLPPLSLPLTCRFTIICRASSALFLCSSETSIEGFRGPNIVNGSVGYALLPVFLFLYLPYHSPLYEKKILSRSPTNPPGF